MLDPLFIPIQIWLPIVLFGLYPPPCPHIFHHYTVYSQSHPHPLTTLFHQVLFQFNFFYTLYAFPLSTFYHIILGFFCLQDTAVEMVVFRTVSLVIYTSVNVECSLIILNHSQLSDNLWPPFKVLCVYGTFHKHKTTALNYKRGVDVRICGHMTWMHQTLLSKAGRTTFTPETLESPNLLVNWQAKQTTTFWQQGDMNNVFPSTQPMGFKQILPLLMISLIKACVIELPKEGKAFANWSLNQVRRKPVIGLRLLSLYCQLPAKPGDIVSHWWFKENKQV